MTAKTILLALLATPLLLACESKTPDTGAPSGGTQQSQGGTPPPAVTRDYARPPAGESTPQAPGSTAPNPLPNPSPIPGGPAGGEQGAK